MAPRKVLLVVAGRGLGEDEAARAGAAVAQALAGAQGEPQVFTVTVETPLEYEDNFHEVLRSVQASLSFEVPG